MESCSQSVRRAGWAQDGPHGHWGLGTSATATILHITSREKLRIPVSCAARASLLHGCEVESSKANHGQTGKALHQPPPAAWRRHNGCAGLPHCPSEPQSYAARPTACSWITARCHHPGAPRRPALTPCLPVHPHWQSHPLTLCASSSFSEKRLLERPTVRVYFSPCDEQRPTWPHLSSARHSA